MFAGPEIDPSGDRVYTRLSTNVKPPVEIQRNDPQPGYRSSSS